MYISKLARSQPPSPSPDLPDQGLQTCSITASRCVSPNSLDHGLQVQLSTDLITASKLTQLQHPSAYRQTRSITITECISKFTRSRHPGESPISLDYCCQVHVHSCLITASESISAFTWSSLSGASRIALKHRLQPQSRYTMCRWVAILIHSWEYKLNTWVPKIIEQ